MTHKKKKKKTTKTMINITLQKTNDRAI